MKKILIILLIFVLFIAVFAGAWWFLMRGTGDGTSAATSTPRSFNPFGMFGGDETGGTEDNTGNGTGFPDVPYADNERQLLTQISDKPVAGVAAVQVSVGTSTDYIIRYVERETGHVYDYSLVRNQTTRISNTTIPRVREALFGNSGKSVVFRRIQDDGETVETFFGSIADAATNTPSESRLSGVFLPENILTIAVHPTQHRALYITKTDTGGAGFLVSTSSTQNVFSHPFYQWRADWNTDTSLIMTTAPSRSVGGIAFLFDTGTKTLTRVSSTTPALTVLPNKDTDAVLLGSVNQRGLGLFSFDTKTKQTKALSIATLPEKCTWARVGLAYCAIPSNTAQNVPDSWYQGTVSFLDTLWKIDMETGNTTYLLDPSSVIKGGADMIHLTPSQDGTHLAFINKKDGTLWLADLSRITEPAQTDNSY